MRNRLARSHSGRPRADWLAVSLLRPGLTEVEFDDVHQTLVARVRAGAPVTDALIAEIVDALVGIEVSAQDTRALRAALGQPSAVTV